MDIQATLISKFFRAEPFASDSLDELAEKMNVTKILKRNKLDRYYKSRFLLQGGMASFNRVFFDAKYLEMLRSDEVLAVAAHEFTHLNERHGCKKFWRLLLPSIVVGATTLLFCYYSWGNYIASGLTGVVVTFCVMITLFVLNLNWGRQQELECDLSSVKINKGEAMISALIKLSNIRPKGNIDIKLANFSPYPSLEQRINEIRKKQNATH